VIFFIWFPEGCDFIQYFAIAATAISSLEHGMRLLNVDMTRARRKRSPHQVP
jgi:hypothetical protein